MYVVSHCGIHGAQKHLLKRDSLSALENCRELHKRVDAHETGREPLLGVDGEGRAYRVLEDAEGAVLVTRSFHPSHRARPPALDPPPAKRAGPKRRKVAVDLRPPAKASRKRVPTYEALASTPLQIHALAADLLADTADGDQLWLAKVLRDDLGPYVLDLRKRAHNEIKRQERAERRMRGVYRQLGAPSADAPAGTRRSARAPVDYREVGEGKREFNARLY